ncbi:hypothetical protein D3C75_901840 [compost metagenome]
MRFFSSSSVSGGTAPPTMIILSSVARSSFFQREDFTQGITAEGTVHRKVIPWALTSRISSSGCRTPSNKNSSAPLSNARSHSPVIVELYPMDRTLDSILRSLSMIPLGLPVEPEDMKMTEVSGGGE